MKCLADLISNIYQYFCSKEYVCTAFVNVKGACDVVHIPTSISRLLEIRVPHSVCFVIQSLLSCRLFLFISPKIS